MKSKLRKLLCLLTVATFVIGNASMVYAFDNGDIDGQEEQTGNPAYEIDDLEGDSLSGDLDDIGDIDGEQQVDEQEGEYPGEPAPSEDGDLDADNSDGENPVPPIDGDDIDDDYSPVGDSDDLESDTASGSSTTGTTVSLSSNDYRLAYNTLFELVATPKPSGATIASWTSTNENIAKIQMKVGNSAYIKAVGYGNATIRVTTDDGAFDECTITVPEPIHVSSVKLNKSSATLSENETLQLSVTVNPADAADKSVTWSSNDQSVATVTSSGLVKAVSPGAATITVTSKDSNKTATCKITVKAPVAVTSVKMSTSTVKTMPGKKCAITATIYPSNAANLNLDWTTTNANVASLEKTATTSREQNVITINGIGEATITATSVDGGLYAACIITSDTIHVSSVRLNKSSVSIGRTESLQLTATVSPTTVADKTITWSSDNTNVATVTASGLVQAVAPGEAYIYATATDNGKSAKCKVTVKAPVPVSSISLNSKSYNTNIGKSYDLYATINPSNAENLNVTWTNSNPNVARLAKNATKSREKNTVEIIGVGEAVITVKPADGSNYSASCKITSTPIKVSGLRINQTSASLAKGATLQLSVTVSPETAANKAVAWSSTNTSVASVNANGLVTAIKGGSATIKATAQDGSGKSTSCRVTVGAVKVTEVKLNKTSASLKIGETVTLSATAGPANADNKTIKWSCSPSSVASVSDNGVVIAKKAGTAKVTATAVDGSGKKAVCKVKVTDPNVKVTGVKLNKSSASIDKGKTITLTATVKPKNASNTKVTWKSSNTSIATVSSDGVVTAKKAGTATITATTKDGNKKATCKVTVKEAKTVKVTGVSLNKTSASVEKGNSITLKATIKPSNATNKNVTWKSSDKRIATVDSNGKVKGVKKGTATITVTTKDGSKKATCKVTVGSGIVYIN